MKALFFRALRLSARPAAIPVFAVMCLLAAAPRANADAKTISVRVTPDQPSLRIEPVGNPTEHNAALFVGVNRFKYARGIRPLNYAVDDAIAQAYLFVITLKLLPAQNCYLALSGSPSKGMEGQLKELDDAKIQRIEADKSSLIDAIISVANQAQQRSDLIVVSFSSHGFEYRNEPYVVPSDGRWGEALSDTALPCKRVEELIRGSKAGKRLLFVDACQDRPGNDSSKGIDGVMTSAFMHAFGAAEGQAVFYSCYVGQVSYEDPTLGHGVFTSFLLKGLQGEAPKNKDGFITVGAVSDYVSKSVKEYVIDNKLNAGGPAQTPSFSGPGDAREIPLAIDPGIRSKSEEFRTSAKQAIQDLKIKINDDGPGVTFTSDLNGRLAKELRTLKFDDAGNDLLANIQSFVKGTMKEEVFVPYAEGILKQRAAEAKKVTPLQEVLKQAEAGDATAVFRLAGMYARGTDGVERDEKKAMVLYRQAAEAANADAMTELGRRYFQEYSTGIDNAEAFRWLKRAAEEQSDPKAMFYLAMLYEKGRGTAKSQADAMQWYARAQPKLEELANSGDGEAMSALGTILLQSGDSGKGATGRGWLEKAGDLGDANAMLNLGYMYENGIGVAQDDATAFKWYNNAAQHRSPAGMFHLAQCYATGRGTTADASLAIDWYSRAAEAGHPTAALHAGMMHENGEGVRKNETTAQSFFQRGFDALHDAAQRGDSVTAMYELGESYDNGWPAEKKDHDAAMVWYFKAANRGDTKAAQRLGDIYAAGEGVPRDDDMAMIWYRKSHLSETDARMRLSTHQAQ